MCKCWHGQLRCFPQSFLPGCDGHVMDEHLIASRTPELTLSACALMLPGESAALNMTANLENSAVATGLEKVSFHSDRKSVV